MIYSHTPSSRRAVVRSISHSFLLGWREAKHQKYDVAAMFLTYAVYNGIWASIWNLVSSGTMEKLGLSYVQIVWYIGIVQISGFAIGAFYKEIQADIREGQVTSFFLRPISYTLLRVSEELGTGFFRLILLLLPCLAYTYILAGQWVWHDVQLLILLIMIVLSSCLRLIFQFSIGHSAVWIRSVRPVNMIIGKFINLFGGLIMPLSVYPDWLKTVAWATPFPVVLYAPGSLVLDSSWSHIGIMMGAQIFWLVVGIGGLALLKKAFEERILRQGEA